MIALSICLLAFVVGVMAERFIDAYEERTEVLKGEWEDDPEVGEDGQ